MTQEVIHQYKMPEAKDVLRKALKIKTYITKSLVRKFFNLHGFSDIPTAPDHLAYCTKKPNFEDLIKSDSL